MRYLFFMLFVGSAACAQPLSDAQKLRSLGHVWGFLKYYHPVVATGQLDWDQRLIELLPTVQKAQNRAQLSAIYDQVLTTLGPVKPCRKCQAELDLPTAHRRNLDLSSLADSATLTAIIRDRLAYLKANRYQGNSHYVQQVKAVNNTAYENENAYADMPMPDESYRLLALFRYWNIIHYFFPYKYAIDGNWNDVLTRLIPVFQQVNTPEAYQKALFQMVASINDSHGFMTTTDKTRCMRCDLGTLWLPFEVQLISDKAVISHFYTDSLPMPAELRVGTVVTAIDGQSIRTHVERLRPYVSASNEAALLRDIRNLVGVSAEKTAKLTINRGGRDTAITVLRYRYLDLGRKVSSSVNTRYPVNQWLSDSIGYVNMGLLTSRQVDSVMKPLMTAKTIIFDLRNYPKGTYWLVKRYLTGKSTPFAQFTGPNLRFPGVFTEAGAGELMGPTGKPFTGKVIVLINEETQSHAEFTAMAFRTYPNTVLVGSPTAGADGNISWVPLPGGYRTAFSGIGVYYPDGRETQRIGILPDVLVQPTIAGISTGHDEVLERAVELARHR